MRNLPVYKHLAHALLARENCERMGNDEWFHRHQRRADYMVENHLPSGSGFDSGTSIDWERSTSEKIVLYTSFHHMDEHGGYDGWTEHTVTLRPSFPFDFDLRVSGKDRNQIKEYIGETFDYMLREEVEPSNVD